MVLLVGSFSCLYSQSHSDIKAKIDSSISLKNIQDYPQRFGQPKFRIDSVQVELYFGSELIAIIPGSMRNFVNEKFVISTDYKSEIFDHGKVLVHFRKKLKIPSKIN